MARAGSPRAAADTTSAMSPLSLVSGATAGATWTDFTFNQSTADSSAHYHSNGVLLTVGLLVKLRGEHAFLDLAYTSLSLDSKSETTTPAAAAETPLTNSLSPDLRRFGLMLAAENGGAHAGRYRIEGGYRWLWSDFTRRDFRSGGAHAAGAPTFTTDRYRLGGPAAAGVARVPLGSAALFHHPLRVRVEAEGVWLQTADIETSTGTEGGRHGVNWDGRAGVETGGDSWSLLLAWSTGGVNVDAAGGAFRPNDPVSHGKATIRENGVALLLRAGSH